MNFTETIKYKEAVQGWIDHSTWENPFAVTLTFKRCITNDSIQAWLRNEDIQQNVRHFLKCLNKKLLSKAERKRGHRIGTLVVLEGTKNIRPHCHLMIECPDPQMAEKLPSLIEELWLKTTWGYAETETTPCDPGWLDYILKMKSKPDYPSAMQVENWHLPLRQQQTLSTQK